MNRKLLLVLPTLVVAMVALGASNAFAIPLPVHLFVTEPSGGTVTDTLAPTGQINCGAGGDDCGQVYTAVVTCNPDGDCTAAGPPETLVASGFPSRATPPISSPARATRAARPRAPRATRATTARAAARWR